MSKEEAMKDVSKTVQFVLEIEKLKGVLRKVRPIGKARYENTAEHSWQIALFAISLADGLNLKIDVNRVVAMLLVHDLGEIDAGDKFVFAHEGWEERKAEELKAVERICGLTPGKTRDFLVSLWKEFDAGESYEAPLRESYARSHRPGCATDTARSVCC